MICGKNGGGQEESFWSHLEAVVSNYIYSFDTKVFQFKISKVLLSLLLYSLHPDFVLVIKY